jgi:hypothetical protein
MPIIFKDSENNNTISVCPFHPDTQISVAIHTEHGVYPVYLDIKTAIALSKELRKSIAEVKNKSNG